jgi:transcriptional regulator with XRE-family HTH domain
MAKRNPKVIRRYESCVAGRELRSWMDQHRITYSVLAELIGYTRAVISRWVGGYQRPRWLDWYKIEHLTGIPFSHWLTDEERLEIKKAKIAIDRVRKARPVRPHSAAELLAGKI